MPSFAKEGGGMFQLMRRLWRLKIKPKTSTIVGKNPSFGLTLFERNMREKLNPSIIGRDCLPSMFGRIEIRSRKSTAHLPF